jgi:hypothetical protein
MKRRAAVTPASMEMGGAFSAGKLATISHLGRHV